MTLQLPKTPTGDFYEDLVAASLLTLGYFVETSITFKEGGAEVLEIDCVASPCGPDFAKRRLVEAKSGKDCGFSDLFKLFGQRIYLGIEESVLARMLPISDVDAPTLQQLGDTINAHARHFTVDSALSDLAPSTREINDKLRTKMLSAAWYQRVAHRLARKKFHAYAKSSASPQSIAAKKYRDAIQYSFFQPSPIARVRALYDAYRASPKLTGSFVEAIGGTREARAAVWTSFNNGNEMPWLQFVAMMECTARLRILKNAIDYLVAREAGAGEETVRIEGREISWDQLLDSLAPRNFRAALDVVGPHPHRLRIPYLMQVFIQVFGGFLCLNDDFDLQVLGEITGIPAADVKACIDIWDTLFPMGGESWFYEPKGEIRVMKMVPGIYRGVGAFFRSSYRDIESYSSFYPKMGWLLTKWHNASYEFLEPILLDKTAT